MDIRMVIAVIETTLSEEKIIHDVKTFLDATERKMELDEGVFEIPRDVRVFIEKRLLVVDKASREGGYLVSQVALDPCFSDGGYTGLSHEGTLKIMYDFDGNWTDEVYSRDNAVPRDCAVDA